MARGAALRKGNDALSLPLAGHGVTSATITGVWRSLVARQFWVLQAAGSNPAAPTNEPDEPMTARIYKPSRTAMQSGQAKTKLWLLEHEPEEARSVEPLMGWTSSGDTRAQVKLWFETKEEAIAYAEREGLAYRVAEPKDPTRKSVSYSDNFKVSRNGQWTH
jgi:ETC complex I subunit conserved region